VSRKIRVLEFTHQRDWGGTDKNSQLMMQHYDKNKFEVIAASYVGGPRAQWIKDNQIPNLITENNEEMIAWLKSQSIDVVHFYRGGWTESRDIAIFKMAGIPVLIERNCFADFDASNDRALIDKHVFCSNVSVDIYKKRSGTSFDASKATMIYPPTDVDMFDGINRDWSEPTFGRISRKDVQKWHPTSIHSLPLIRESVPSAKFHVVGIPDSYWSLIEQLGVKDMIIETVIPTDAHLVDFFKKITVFAHSSSIGESFGNVMAEAMAAGLPVVTHTGWDSAQTELTTDGYNGYIVDPDDTRAYADKIIYLLKNPTQKRIMGYFGRSRSRELYNIKTVVDKYQDLFVEQCKIKGII